MTRRQSVSNKELDFLEDFILNAQEADFDASSTSSSSIDELSEFERIILNAREESEEPLEEPQDSASNALLELEDMIINAKEPDNVDLNIEAKLHNSQVTNISTRQSTKSFVTTSYSHYREQEEADEEEQIDKLLFELTDTTANDQQPQSSTQPVSTSRQTEASTSRRRDDSEDIFGNMGDSEPESTIPPPLAQPRKILKRKLPDTPSHDNTYRINGADQRTTERPSTQAQSSATGHPSSSYTTTRRLISPQPDAVRLTTADFENNTSQEDPLAANVKATKMRKTVESSIRTLPKISIVVGPPDSADEYEWSDTGLTPPASPEGPQLPEPLWKQQRTWERNQVAPQIKSERSLSYDNSPFQMDGSSSLAPPPRTSLPPPVVPPPRPSETLAIPLRPQVASHVAPVTPNPIRRRKVKTFWSPQELDALESGLETHGWGHWAAIKRHNPTILKDRDSVALKDKARNEATRRQKQNVPLGPYSGCPFIAV